MMLLKIKMVKIVWLWASIDIINVNKIMKTIINANSLSPWSDDVDIDTFLAPPPAPPLKNPTGNSRQESERQQQRM